MQNSGSETWVFGLSDKSGQEISHSDAQEELKLHDVYALSVLDEAPETGAYGTHVSNMSSPTGKKERIAFVNEEFTYSEDNAADAGGIRDRNSAYQNKRLFSTHPYSGYIMESRHISTIKPSYLNSVFSGEAGNKKAKFISDTTIGNTRYKSGTEITEDVYTKLLDNN